nr:TadE family type IV pilus minor pilin [Arthrobacter sp. ERGS1:01]
MRGSVTAEFAVVLPAITVLLALLLLGGSAAILQIRLEEGARAGARSLARGESSAQAVDASSRLAGEGVSVSVELTDGYATVTISGHTAGPFAAVLAWQQTARATARVENYEPGADVGMPRGKPEQLAAAKQFAMAGIGVVASEEPRYGCWIGWQRGLA